MKLQVILLYYSTVQCPVLLFSICTVTSLVSICPEPKFVTFKEHRNRFLVSLQGSIPWLFKRL
jgi:hypothetical protein